MNIYPLNQIASKPPEKFTTGIDYFDKVLDGGLVKSSTTLMAGMSGAGKSSLLTQVSYGIAENGNRVLYIAGEESKEQIKMRTDRLAINSNLIFLYEEVEVSKVIEAIKEINPELVIIDSMQMLYSNTIKTAPATPTQMRYGLMTLCKLAKDDDLTIIFVGHSTKGGYVAGLQSFQHMVDVVLYLGINDDDTRFIKVNKNRFGQTGITTNLYMSKYGLFDTNDVIVPFGEIKKDRIFSLEEINKITEGQLIKPVIVASYKWLKKEAITNPNVNICNGTATLTSGKIKAITEGHLVWGKVVDYSMNWLLKHQQ